MSDCILSMPRSMPKKMFVSTQRNYANQYTTNVSVCLCVFSYMSAKKARKKKEKTILSPTVHWQLAHPPCTIASSQPHISSSNKPPFRHLVLCHPHFHCQNFPPRPPHWQFSHPPSVLVSPNAVRMHCIAFSVQRVP